MDETKWRRAEVIFAGAITFFTAVLVVVSIAQWRTANRELNASEEAFVFVNSMEMEPKENIPPQFVKTATAQILVHVKNSGNTPAKQLFTAANSYLNPPEDFDYPDFVARPHIPTFIGPQEEILLVLQLPSYLAALSARQGHSRLKVYGHIEYVDTIAKKPHRTWFCFNLASYPVGLNTPVGHEAFSACEEHNCADDDCPEPWDFKPAVIKEPTESLVVELPPIPTATATATATPNKRKKRHG